MPDSWLQNGRLEYKLIVDRIKSGLAFYCIEDFLWPNGREGASVDVWAGFYWRGYTGNLYQLGKGELPTLSEALWTPRDPGVQPVAIRTYGDALQYQRAGWIYERQSFSVASGFQHLLGGNQNGSNQSSRNQLYYWGDYPSRIAECMAPEIKHILDFELNDDKSYVPPSAAYEHAFHRQTQKLRDAWNSCPDAIGRPGIEWVRQHLTHPEYLNDGIENGYVDRYRKALLASLKDDLTW
ncbi:MAG: hypothetical protein ABJN52_16970 [Litorimonas sp.]